MALILLVIFTSFNTATSSVSQINELVTQWAPLIWLSAEERFFPVGVETFLRHVKVADEAGNLFPQQMKRANVLQSDSSNLYLVTRTNIDFLMLDNETSILRGENPSRSSIPVYVVIQTCTPNLSFHSSEINTLTNDINKILSKTNQNLFFTATYWTFYPYNKGKDVCFLGNVPTIRLFGTCFGHVKTIGNHVGDWERVTLWFRGNPYPSEMYLSVHDTGSYYTYDIQRKYFKHNPKKDKKRKGIQKAKFPPILRVQKGHPVLFSAEGSHGLWGSTGDHEYVKIPRLIDRCSYGVPWKTWENLIIFGLEDAAVPHWVFFKGKWGNPSSNCVFSKKFGVCEHVDGPSGIVRPLQDFIC